MSYPFLKQFFDVVGFVVGKSKIFLKERSYLYYTVRFFSNLNYSLSVLIWCKRVSSSSKQIKNTVVVKV